MVTFATKDSSLTTTDISNNAFVAQLTLYDGGVPVWSQSSADSGAGGGTVTITITSAIPSSSSATMLLQVTDVSQGGIPSISEWGSGVANIWEAQTISITIGVSEVSPDYFFYVSGFTVTTTTTYTAVSVLINSVSEMSYAMNTSQSALTISASLTGSGSGSPSYSWTDNGTQVSTASSFSYSPSTAGVGTHVIVCIITDTNGGYTYTVTSRGTIITIYNPQTLIVSYSPSTLDVEIGQILEFNVNVSGGSGSFSYQWYSGANIISGAVGSVWLYEPSNTSLTGTSISCYVTDVGLNTSYPVTSSGYTINVYTPMSVTISPAVGSFAAGGSLGFSVSVSGGSSSYAYQWYADGASQSGQTSSSFTYSTSTSGSHGVYCQVTDNNTGAVIVTQEALVNVTGGISVSIQSSIEALVGVPFTLSVSANGGAGGYTYQWYSNTSDAVGGTVISGATSPSITQTLTSTQTMYYSVIVYDRNGAGAWSNVCVVSVYSSVTLDITSNETTSPVNNAVTLTATASGGSGNYSYQWYMGSSPITTSPVDSVTLSGYTSNPLTATSSIAQSQSFMCRVTDTTTSVVVYSNSITINWINQGVILSTSNSSVTQGNSVTLTATPIGLSGTLTYDFYENGTSVQSGSGSTYTFSTTSSTPVGTDSFYVTVGGFQSNTIAINVVSSTPTNSGFSVTLAVTPTTITLDGTATATATVTGSGTITYSYYQVLSNGTWQSLGSSYTNISSNTIDIPSTITGTVGKYLLAVMATIGSASADSTPISFTVSASPVGSGTNQTFTGNMGASNTFTVYDTTTSSVVYGFNINMTRSFGVAGILTFSVPMTSGGVSPVSKGDRIEIGYNGKQLFLGFVWDVVKNSAMYYDITAYDGLYNMGMLTGSYNPPNTITIATLINNYVNAVNAGGVTYLGSKITGSEISVELGADFNNQSVLNLLEQLAIGFNYHLVNNPVNNVALLTAGTSVRTLTENQNGMIVLSKEFNSKELYNNFLVEAIETDTGSQVQAISATTSGTTQKVIGNGWLYITSSQTAELGTMGGNFLAQYENGVWIVQVYSAWSNSSYQWDIADVDSSGNLYTYTITFADGTVLSNLIMTDINLVQGSNSSTGVTWTFRTAEDSWLNALVTSLQAATG